MAVLLVFAALCLVTGSFADVGQCYTCTYNQNADRVGYDCVADPDAVPSSQRQCNTASQCYTERQVSVATGEVYTLNRGCDELGNKQAVCTTDFAYETCVTTCNDGDLCNSLNHTTIPLDPEDDVIPDSNSTEEEEFVMCYSCQYNPAAPDTCINNPTAVPTIKCPAPRTCYIDSHYNKLEDRMETFARGCEDYSNIRKTCVDSALFYDCLYTCCEDECNTGDGSRGGEHPSCRPPTSPPSTSSGPGRPTSPPSGPGDRSSSACHVRIFQWLLLLSLAPISISF